MGFIAEDLKRAKEWLAYRDLDRPFCPARMGIEGSFTYLAIERQGKRRVALVDKEYTFYQRLCTEEDYARRDVAAGSGSGLSWRGRSWLLGLTIVGAVALFRWATMPLGVVLLAGALIGWTYPMWSRSAQRRLYREATYAHGPVTVRVSDRGVSYQGGSLTAESAWRGVKVWGIQNEQLWIAAAGMPPVYLSIAELQDRGLYDRVLGLAQQNGVEFDSPKAHASVHAPAT